TRYSDPNIYSIHIATSINHAWKILDKYYQLTDVSKVLYSAVALDPEMRLQYFESEWKDRPEWILLAKEKSKSLW
ncbi:hypothetical protein L873DRAFT_1630172, partial [Choiromyces venosus 120613-1]